MSAYPWAQNVLKLQRALSECGPDATEEAVQERYCALGGALQYVYPVAPEKVEKPVKKAAKKK